MCGPLECALFERGLLQRLASDRATQIWLIVWVPLAVCWLIYFGFACAKLSSDGNDATFRHYVTTSGQLVIPALSICSASSSEKPTPLQAVNCTVGRTKPLTVVGVKEQGSDCFIFFNITAKSKYLGWPASDYQTFCSLQFDAAATDGVAYVFLYDQKYNGKVAGEPNEIINLLAEGVPNGLSYTPVFAGEVTQLRWQREEYLYLSGHTPTGAYPIVDSETGFVVPAGLSNTSSSLQMTMGDTWTRVYVEHRWKSGYDFWYFIGMLGGVSFLFLMLHSAVFSPVGYMFGASSSFSPSSSAATPASSYQERIPEDSMVEVGLISGPQTPQPMQRKSKEMPKKNRPSIEAVGSDESL
ncbi:hypothetical protein QOT17_013276 [Balamuthia mandrillaris]